MEQRELFFQSDIIYINTRNVLFWVIVSFASPVVLGLLYLIFRGGLRSSKLCGRSDSSGSLKKKNVLLRAVLSLLSGGLVVWVVSHLDFRWADRQAVRWIGEQDLGKLLLGSQIGPMALVAILFLIIILCVVWISQSDESVNLEDDLMGELSCDDQNISNNMEEKPS
jgi:hypothetical protein